VASLGPWRSFLVARFIIITTRPAESEAMPPPGTLPEDAPFDPGSGRQRKQLVMLEQRWPPRCHSAPRSPAAFGWPRASGCSRCWDYCSCWRSPACVASTTWRSK
jgi:hypothetical protein